MLGNPNFGVYDHNSSPEYPHVVYRQGVIGYIKRSKSKKVKTVSPKNLELMNKLLTPEGVKKCLTTKKTGNITRIKITRL